jgi:hypothetical protein
MMSRSTLDEKGNAVLITSGIAYHEPVPRREEPVSFEKCPRPRDVHLPTELRASIEAKEATVRTTLEEETSIQKEETSIA